MPRHLAPRQKLSYGWTRGEDFWGDPMSDNMVYTDAMLHPSPVSMSQPTPPVNPPEGTQYIVPADAQFEWAGKENALTMFIENKWVFFAPFRGVRVHVQDYAFVWFDGLSWVAEPASGASSPDVATRYDVVVSVGYAPEVSETLLMLPIVQPMRLMAGAPLSLATATTPPTKPVSIQIQRNGTQVGTVTFTPSSFNGTFLVPSDVTLGIGDRIRVITPTSVPPNFGDFGMVIRMSLLN